MTREDFRSLQSGDIVRSDFCGQVYIVSANYGDRVTAVQTVDMTNPPEWTLIAKAEHRVCK